MGYSKRRRLPKLRPPLPLFEASSAKVPVLGQLNWPNQLRFPVNFPPDKRAVFPILEADMRASADFLAITGFTSLSFLVELFGLVDLPTGHQVRLGLGFDPEGKTRKNWPKVVVSQEIRNYWLDRRFSITQLGALLRTADLLRHKRLQVRAADKLHAKIYVATDHATLGSSNFSASGTRTQPEAQCTGGPRQPTPARAGAV